MNTTKNNKADNKICVEGARALSEALKVNTTLTTLDLTGVQQQDNVKQQTTTNKEQNRQRDLC